MSDTSPAATEKDAVLFSADSKTFNDELGNRASNDSDGKADIRDFIRETRPWYKVPHLVRLSFTIFLITLTSTNNGFDGSLLNGLQSLTHWASYFGHPTGQKLGALSNATLFGSIAVFPICPFISDKYGRRASIFIGQSLTIVGGVLQGATVGDPNKAYAMFFVARFIMGAGMNLASVAAPALISELSYPLHRDISTFSYNIQWYLGATFIAIITYLTKDIDNNACWKIPSYLQAFFPAIQVVTIWFLPESPRYLIAKNKFDAAEKILTKHHVGGSEDPRDKELIKFEMDEIQAALIDEREAGENSKYTDFWTRKTYRKRLFLICFIAIFMQLSGNGLVSYYLNKVLNSIGYTETDQQLKINMCLMIYNFVVCVIICSTSAYFRRRTLFITCVFGMLGSYIVWTALSAVNQQRNFEQKSLGQGVLAMIFFYYLSYNIGANGLPILYVTEILPYSHRAKGFNIFQLTMQIVLVYNGYVNPIAMDAIDWKYYIVYCCILAVECVIVYFFIPETSGRTLEEVAEVFGDLDVRNDVRNAHAAAGYNSDSKGSNTEHAEHA